jgi:hypothetical protein
MPRPPPAIAVDMLPAVQCDAAQTDRRGDRHRGPNEILQDPHALESTKLRRTLAGARVFRVAQEDVKPDGENPVPHLRCLPRSTDNRRRAVHAELRPGGLVVSRMMKHIQK